VNSHQTSTSTTDTQHWKPGQVVLTAGIASIALSAHVLLRVSLVPSTVVAVAIVRPQAALGALYGVLIAVCGMLYIPVKGVDPSDYFTRALANITNGISGRDLIPDKAPVPQPALSVLPPASNAARAEDEPEFWQLVHDRLNVSGGRPGVVPAPATGRHAKIPAGSVPAPRDHSYAALDIEEDELLPAT
jgi:hypothetical protein